MAFAVPIFSEGFDCNSQQILIGNAYCLNIFRIWLTYRAGITFTAATSHLLFKMHPVHLRAKSFLNSQIIVCMYIKIF